MRFLADLDAEQREAVTFGEGPLLVIAGAGSGKTRVLTYRIAYLLAAGRAEAQNILAVTFTNKAAREMAERVERLLGGPLAGGFVGTFHRFALALLRQYPQLVGLPPRFAIADEDEQRRLVEQILRELGIPPSQLSPRAARSAISRWKNGSLGREHELLEAVVAAYQQRLAQAGAVDFDDMLVLAVRLLAEQQELRERLRQRFTYLLVDEFQDTNPIQMELLWHLGGSRPNLTAVGDEDQSIYRFRGAELEHILRFEHTYPGAKVLTLGNNYRSTEAILEAAGAVIAHNSQRRGKVLRACNGGGEPVRLWSVADEQEEASWVVADIRRQRAAGMTSLAVLFRLNALSRPFEEELVRWAIPYRVVGGVRFWDRAEVKDALAYLRLLVNPNDQLAFLRVVNVPARGLGAVAVERLAQAAQVWGCSVPEASRRLPETLTPRARQALQAFWQLLEDLRPGMEGPLDRLVQELLQRSGLLAQFSAQEEEDRGRLANLDQLVAAAGEATRRGLSLAGFLDEVALLSEADSEGAPEAVLLSTLHAAKGLEFDGVYLVGLEEGLLPLLRGDEASADEEEERRLMYVGMTRARKLLTLTWARSRRLHGEARSSRPSRFLAELPLAVRQDRIRLVPPPVNPRPPAGPAESKPSPGREQGFRPGMRVEHATFGRGVVLQVQASGAQTRVVVFFDRAGKKTLIPTLAHLKVVGGKG
ncbi:MAG: UvrD-helicase domain-containing protein [Thermoanaerobaculum sp.]|nr:UvrD-helicase domain-containing protein [Thermoanaerobaculum sp.]MDW7968086.1 UvrD-helicase domain-containing protein [Thermoanaerobaculum sp.]